MPLGDLRESVSPALFLRGNVNDPRSRPAGEGLRLVGDLGGSDAVSEGSIICGMLVVDRKVSEDSDGITGLSAEATVLV